MKENEPKIIMEDVAGMFGFRCRYEVKEDAVGVMVWQIIGRQPEGLKLALFAREDSDALTPDCVAAKLYIAGAFRSDGRVWLTGEQVFMGGVGARKHTALLKHLFLKAYGLMGLDGEKAWKQEP